MASSPLVQAVEHFSLAQLIADPNLCRNVLNDIGAQPAETFLLVAALDARVPQTLIEHSSTNDPAVVEPRLVTELTDRGIERSRAIWAVNEWKEAVSGSTLGLQTARPSQSETVRPSQAATVRPTQPAPAPAPAPAHEPPPIAPRPVTHPSTAPMPRGGRRRRTGVIAAAAIVVLLVAGLLTWRLWPSSKHGTAGPTGTVSSHGTTAASSPTSAASAVSSAAASSTAPANLSAPLGAAKTFAVAGTAAWTATGLQVTKGERINVTAGGQINPGPGLSGPEGLPGANYDVYSIIGGGHIGALIGLIGGSDAPFLIGASYNGLAPATGELYLGINDIAVGDNAGQYTVSLRLQQS